MAMNADLARPLNNGGEVAPAKDADQNSPISAESHPKVGDLLWTPSVYTIRAMPALESLRKYVSYPEGANSRAPQTRGL